LPEQSLSGLSPAELNIVILSQLRLTLPGRTVPRIYILQEQGGPVIPLVTGFPFHRLLRLAGLEWRYSNPPPHRSLTKLPKSKSKSKLYYDWRSVGQSVLVLGMHLGPATNFSHLSLIIFRQLRICWCGPLLWRETWSVVFSFCWASPAQPFTGLSPTGLMSIFHYLYFWTSLSLENQVPVFISFRNRIVQLYILTKLLKSRYDGRSVSLYVLVSGPLWYLRPDINSVWKLLYCLCGAPSLTRGRVCPLSVTVSSICSL
jgi:hypothetical protein